MSGPEPKPKPKPKPKNQEKAIATDDAPAVNPPVVLAKRETVGRGKDRTKRRSLVARMAPSSGTRTRAEREMPLPPLAKSVARSECDPPFVIDASGIKRMKVSCL